MKRPLVSPMLLMSAFVLFAVPALPFGATFAREEISKTYRCIAKDAVSIREDGTLNKEVGEKIIEAFDKIVIDVSNGHITFPNSGKREEWIVGKTSVDDNDYVLFPSLSRRITKKAVADAATRFIRLRVTNDKQQARFMAFTLSYLATGICTILP